MPWTCPLHTKNKVNRAGAIIAGREKPTADFTYDEAMDVAGNWRSSHGYPLQSVWTTLRVRAKNVDPKSLVAKRQKRMPSIIAKLARFDDMQLARMHDLGGCRAVVSSVRRVDKLVKMYADQPLKTLEFVKPYDYIREPKDDGYRSVHLVYKYQGDSQNGAFRGLRIEIQIRSRLQHAWATALETIDAFTGQSLKASGGEDTWRRFFALISTAIAKHEKRAPVPNTPTRMDTLISEICDLCVQLKIPGVFEGISAGLEIAPKMRLAKKQKAEAYLLTLDSKERVTVVTAFVNNKEAEEKLLESEKENLDKPHIQTVMASANSIQSLRTAYPNYFLDTDMFIGFVTRLIQKNAN